VSPRAVIFANGSVAGFAALPPLLARLAPGDEVRVVILPTAEIGARVVSSTTDRMQTGTSLFDVRRYELLLADPGGSLAVSVTTATDGALLRVAIPAQGLEVLRADLAGATSRTTVTSNPGDQAVIIPASGFNLGATLTMPTTAAGQPAAGRDGPQKLPAVVLVSGSRAADRDALVPGVPTMAQLAGALADGGFVVVRYDRRGAGQSGGRAESATLADYAEDARTIVRWLSARKDVDAKRIALVGHGEGAWEALLAASKEKRVAAVVTLDSGGTAGADLVLEQQQLQLEHSSLSPADRASRVALQKQIHDAVLTGKGWGQLSPEIRKLAVSPWFASLLAFDPARVLQSVDVPLLIVHGDLDREIPVAHADRLAALARKGDSPSVAVTIVRGVNHVLLPAFTGDVSEYATLADRTISRDTSTAVVTWLAKTLVAPAR
jgi:pimeloyl-ACP methyl ester carboxylesterase